MVLRPGCVELFGRQVAFGIGAARLGRHGRGLFQIRRVSATLAEGHEIFPGIGRHHELVRLAAAHGAGVGFHHGVPQSAALENAAIGLVVLVVGGVQAGLVHVERVGVLHEELAHAQETGFRPRFVAELGLDLIPDLGELFVAAQFAAGDGGHDLLVRHAEAEVAAEAVLQPEHVVAHHVPAAGFLPDLGRIQRGQVHLLPADGVHLLAHDLLDLEERALGQEQVAVDAGGKLAHVAGAQQQLMAGDLGFGGILAQGRDE